MSSGEEPEPTDDSRGSAHGPRRRTLLAALSTASVGLLAGCSGGSESAQSGPDSERATTNTADASTSGEPSFEIRAVTSSSDSVRAGEGVVVSVSVANTGSGDGSFEAPVAVNKSVRGRVTMDLDAGEERTVEVDIEPRILGDVDVSVGGEVFGQVTVEPPSKLYVSPEGSYNATGLENDPLSPIQRALDLAEPGDTVHALPGRYTQGARTVRPGTPDAPITITGPPEAVYNVDGPFEINHSHVHLRGLTFDGLHSPDAPEDADSYSESIIQVNEAFYETIKNGNRPDEPVTDDEYLTDVVVKPHAVGNCRADFVKVHWSTDVEVGEFEVIGPAGVKYLKGGAEGHNGEIVYIGNPIDKAYPIDETRHVHVHHIDNSAGHAHNELVDVKGGARDVTVEYCTDAGGGRFPLDGAPETSECVVHFGGRECVLRWCVIGDSKGQAVEVGSWGLANPEKFEENKGVDFPAEAAATFGQQNSIYGNEFRDHAGMAVQYPVVFPEDGQPHIADGYGPADQAHVCGNTIDGPTHGTPEADCQADLPTTGTIGHLGGDSPWA